MTSYNHIYCAKIFRPDPNSPAQRDFKINFEPVLREEKLLDDQLSILVDMEVGIQKSKPFILSGNSENFCLSSESFTFFVRKKETQYDSVPMYEVCVDNRWAWVSRLGNEGFALLMNAYIFIRQKRRSGVSR